MAISQQDLRRWLKYQAGLRGVSSATLDTTISDIISAGCSQFWSEDWEFAKVHTDITLTADTYSYRIDQNDVVDTDIDAVHAVRRKTSDDKGRDLDLMTAEEFDALFPYPDAYSSGNPKACKVYTDDGMFYLHIFPPPDATDTLEITWRRGWNLDMLSMIPDECFGVICMYCEAFMVPAETRLPLLEYADTQRAKLFVRTNRVARPRRTTVRLPVTARDYKGDSWDALNMHS